MGKVRWHRLGRYYQHNTIHLAIQYAADRALKDGAHGTQMELMDALHEYETITRALVAEVARAAITATAPLADEARGVVTPAQAIAATLGSSNCTNGERTIGTCHNVSKVMDEHGQARFVCSECDAWIDSRMLWNPEYRDGESPWVSGCKLNYCPNCGRKVVDDG